MAEPTITQLINDRFELEEQLARLIRAFAAKYPHVILDVTFNGAYGDYSSASVRIRTTV